jgi:hypothetical protein
MSNTNCTCPAAAHSDDCTIGAPTVGDRVVLPDGCTGVLTHITDGEGYVLTGTPGTAGCGPWIYPIESLAVA